MHLHELEESQVISIALDQAHLYFAIVVRIDDGTEYKLSAWNAAGSPLEVVFGALQVQANRTDVKGRPTLGELEGASFRDGVLTLEGDFGDVVIRGAMVSINQST